MSGIRELVERHYRNVNEQAFDREAEVLSPDLVTVEPSAGTIRGIEPFMGYLRTFTRAFPDGRLEPKVFVEEGNRVVVEGVYTGTQTGVLSGPGGDVPPSGRRLDLPYCDVFEAEAGRIVAHHVYYDQMLFARQMGLVPDPAGASGD